MDELTRIQQLTEDLSQVIASLPFNESEELSDALIQQTDLNLADFQSLLTATNDLLKSE